MNWRHKRLLVSSGEKERQKNLRSTRSLFLVSLVMPDMAPIPAHHALYLPEIVSQIVSYLLYRDKHGVLIFKDIHPCLFVNRLFHDCAARIMGRNLVFEDTTSDYDKLVKYASCFASIPNAHDNVTSMMSLAVAAPSSCKEDREAVFTADNDKDRMPEQAPPPPSIEPNIPTSQDFYSNNNARFPPPHAHLCPSSNILQHSLPPLLLAKYRHERMQVYHRSLRTLSVRKIKQTGIIEPLQQIGQYANRLEQLEMYICDHITDAAVTPFLQHRTLTFLTLAGCHLITDELILQVAASCPRLEHLDLRACGRISDVSISAIAKSCPNLKHLNVGRIRDRDRITGQSISLVAKHTQVSVLGLAGCNVDDDCMVLLAKHRNKHLERISVNNCHRLGNRTLHAHVQYCPSLSVFEMKECHLITDWEAVAELVQRKVLLTLCDQQNKACSDWARKNGRTLHVRAPLK